MTDLIAWFLLGAAFTLLVELIRSWIRDIRRAFRRPSDTHHRMIAFVGGTRKKAWVAELKRRHIGRVWQRGEFSLNYLYVGERWAYDNGAYGDHLNMRAFDADQFQKDVETIDAQPLRPYVAVCPDRVASPKSLAFSCEWRDRLPAWSWYLAVQDGMRETEVAAAIREHDFRGIFIGGSDRFKGSAPQWVDLAHRLGLPCHFGRASTPKKMKHAWNVGCDSFDTSFPLWEQRRFWRFLRTVDDHYESPQREFVYPPHPRSGD